MKSLQRVRLCGVDVDCVTAAQLNASIEQAVTSREMCIIANHNLHSMYLSQNDAKMRQFYGQADLVHIDGMGVVALARMFGLAVGRNNRIAYVDWIWELMGLATQHRWRVFYLGSKPGVADKAAAKFRLRFPGLQIKTADGYFDPAPRSPSNRDRIRLIREFQPQLLFVGMGMPRQEHWILENRSELPPAAVFCAGACADFIAGEKPLPPRWLGTLCMEWCYRLGSEPRRLWHRYLVEPWYVARVALSELVSRQTS